IVSPPSHGSLTGSAPNVTYTSAANYNGSDSFTFKANDGTLDSNVATVTLTITAVNDSPVARSSVVTTSEDVAVSGVLAAADADGDPLTFTITVQPAQGLVTITN